MTRAMTDSEFMDQIEGLNSAIGDLESRVEQAEARIRELEDDLRDALNRIHELEDLQPDYSNPDAES